MWIFDDFSTFVNITTWGILRYFHTVMGGFFSAAARWFVSHSRVTAQFEVYYFEYMGVSVIG